MNKHDNHDHHGHPDGAIGLIKTVASRYRVCGMIAQLDHGRQRRKYEGETDHFCTQKSLDKFAADPDHFLADGHNAETSAKVTRYTCDIHLETVRDETGECPLCEVVRELLAGPVDILAAKGMLTPQDVVSAESRVGRSVRQRVRT